MNRRDALKWMLATGASASAWSSGCKPTESVMPSQERSAAPLTGAVMPTIFLAHGAPMLDVDSLLDYRSRAPGVRQSPPTHEHFAPVLASLGATVDAPGAVSFPVTGWIGGSLTKRSVQFD